VGGEYIGSVVFLMERAPAGRRGIAGSWPSVGSIFGFLLGSTLGAAIFGAMPHADVFAWGWRLPFLLGVTVGLTGYLIRRRIRLDEPPSRERFPLAQAARQHPLQMVQAVGISVVNGVGFYLMFSYIVTWLQIYARVTPHVSLLINSINMAIMMPVTLWGGWLSDRIGRKAVLVVAAAGLVVLSWPSLLLMRSGAPIEIFLGQLVFCLFVGVYSAVNPVIIAEIFPAAERSSAASVTYNVTLATAGGTAPIVAIWLIDKTGDPMAMGFYLILAAAISTAASLSIRRRDTA
jgi:MHS family proline/betaine transporter-like MFS transporter